MCYSSYDNQLRFLSTSKTLGHRVKLVKKAIMSFTVIWHGYNLEQEALLSRWQISSVSCDIWSVSLIITGEMYPNLSCVKRKQIDIIIYKDEWDFQFVLAPGV